MNMIEELKEHIELADTLIGKLNQIKEQWEQLPTQDDVDELVKAAGGLAACLDHVAQLCMSDDLPTVEWLEDLAKEAAALAHSLETAMAFKEGEEG